MSRPICAGCGHDLAHHGPEGCRIGFCACRTAGIPMKHAHTRQIHPATLLASDAQAWNAPGEISRSRRKAARP